MWLLNPVAIVNSLPYVLLVVTVLGVYNYAWENPRLEHEARQGYVLEAEATAAKAELAERQRQVAAAITATAQLQAALEKQRAEDQAADAARKKDLTDYAQSLKTAKRSCPLTRDDLDWLRK